MLSFAYLWVFLLLPLPWLVRWLLPAAPGSKVAVRVPFGDRIQALTDKRGNGMGHARSFIRQALQLLHWLLLVTALARPQWSAPPIRKQIPTRDLLLLVDLSGSMRQEDFQSTTGQAIDRLSAVKEVVGEFLEQREGDRIGLVVFGDSAFLQAPFSTDLSLSRRLLDETAIGMAGPRTALGDAIGLGIGLFDESDVTAKTIIALTDGNDTSSQLPPVEASRVAAKRGIRIHTIAIGDPTTAGEEKLDEAALKEVASTTGGNYFFAGDRLALAGIYQELDKIETSQAKVVDHSPIRDVFYWPLAAALILSLCSRAFSLVGAHFREGKNTPPELVQVDPLTGKLQIKS